MISVPLFVRVDPCAVFINVFPQSYSKADWQQKKTEDTWPLSSESRHERGLLELVAVAEADAAAAAAAAAAAFDEAGLTLIVPVLEVELK